MDKIRIILTAALWLAIVGKTFGQISITPRNVPDTIIQGGQTTVTTQTLTCVFQVGANSRWSNGQLALRPAGSGSNTTANVVRIEWENPATGAFNGSAPIAQRNAIPGGLYVGSTHKFRVVIRPSASLQPGQSERWLVEISKKDDTFFGGIVYTGVGGMVKRADSPTPVPPTGFKPGYVRVSVIVHYSGPRGININCVPGSTIFPPYRRTSRADRLWLRMGNRR